MISEQSKLALAAAFQRAAGAGLVRSPGDGCIIVAAEGPLAATREGENLLLITISSFVFRLLTLFHIADVAAARAYFGYGAGGHDRDEGFSEVANLCCGALNRELARHFPHLAMSIPHTLSRHCSAFLAALQPQYLSHYAITLNDSVRLQVTLCMCCSGPVDLAADATAAEHGGGELELF
jgi:hypothetical protein